MTAVLGLVFGLVSGGFHPQAVVLDGITMRCEAYSRTETHYRKAHLFVCAAFPPAGEVFGEITGALLAANGKVLCPVSGAFDVATGCVAADVCGQAFSQGC